LSEYLGLTMRDKITGFQGVVTGHVHYISGCSQLLVSPPAEDGKLREAAWFDEQRCEDVGTSRIVLENGATPGCDMAPPKR